ncbi:murein transglycosylase A [Sandaracinobacteroides hominis]|uniref:murein transglycosylase A n=1 Tax=Sandaracinobacteroides hominis TaxID=2780086 RepID=UPI002E2BF21A|nr:MltA domain-containing protein [Sandaracinobacteroides hominis]
MIAKPVRLAAFAAAAALAACAAPQLPAPAPTTPPPAVAPATPAPIVARVAPAIPAFVATAEAREAFRRACPRLLKRADASGLTRAEDWQAACADADSNPATFFARHFTPVRLGDGKGLATGYFEPEIKAYPTAMPGAAPILARPPELVDLNLKDWGIEGGTIRGLAGKGRVTRAPDRAAIENGFFANRGLELAWAADPVDLFFLHIQGSGRLAMPDGSSFRVGYDGQNGHSYVAIGKLLRDRGILQKAGMAEIKAWLRANPAEGVALMRENPSYIFLRKLPADIDGPIGALGVPLLTEANAAADASVLPLGTPVWLETTLEGQPYSRLVVASDTGGAIKGANRFDIFFGAGEAAGRKAGGLASPLNATLLLPNAAAQRLPQ